VFYHRERNLERKVTLRKLDHAAIYLLIAGTYTPFTLLAMRYPWGWVLFGVVWTLAIVGIAAKLTVGFRFPRLSTFMYLGMGWVGIFAIGPMTENLSNAELAWIIAGGLTYTAGVPFYVWKSRRYMHAVWHLFVLGGVACHFAAVLSVVGGRGA
jgi:hemolysin III